LPHLRCCEITSQKSPDNPFDSIIVGYYQDEKLLYAAKVRNGFVHTGVVK